MNPYPSKREKELADWWENRGGNAYNNTKAMHQTAEDAKKRAEAVARLNRALERLNDAEIWDRIYAKRAAKTESPGSNPKQ